jgi:1-acyl-sn-glycerol-3-phosphate acyltransferase
MATTKPVKKSWHRLRSTGRLALLTTMLISWLAKRLVKWKAIDVKGVNKNAVPMEGPVIVAANHLSFADPLFLAGTSPRNGAMLAKYDLWSWKNPVTALLVRLRGDIAVKRHSDKGRARAFSKAINILLHSGLIGLFPSGKICAVGEDARWAWGFAEMAIKTQATVLPVKLIGTGQLWRLVKDRLHWGGKPINWDAKVVVIYGGPITPKDYAGMTVQELADYTKAAHDKLDVA